MAAEQAPVWVSIEKDLTYPHPVQAFITQTGGEIPHNNPVLTFSQETWRTSHKIIGSNPNFTHKTSLWHNTTLKICKKNILLVWIGEIRNHVYWRLI